MELEREHSGTCKTLEEAQAGGRLIFTPWWKDDTYPDYYAGGTPQEAVVSETTLKAHSDFLRARRSKSLPRGVAIDPVARMVEGQRSDE